MTEMRCSDDGAPPSHTHVDASQLCFLDWCHSLSWFLDTAAQQLQAIIQQAQGQDHFTCLHIEGLSSPLTQPLPRLEHEMSA